MKRILVGVDGSDHAANALRWACALARVMDAEVLVGVAGPRDVQDEAARGHWARPAEEAGVSFQASALGWEPGPSLVVTADTEDVDLLVVGHRGRGGALQIGSVAMYVAHFARVPFAIVPTGAIVRRPERIVVGVDGSVASRAAAEWAGAVAHACGADVVAAHVRRPPEDTFTRPDDVTRARTEEQLTQESVEILRDAARFVETVSVEDGDPATMLLELTGSAEAASVLIIGTRRVGGLRQMRLGGVTMHALHHARVPVVVVPEPR